MLCVKTAGIQPKSGLPCWKHSEKSEGREAGQPGPRSHHKDFLVCHGAKEPLRKDPQATLRPAPHVQSHSLTEAALENPPHELAMQAASVLFNPKPC